VISGHRKILHLGYRHKITYKEISVHTSRYVGEEIQAKPTPLYSAILRTHKTASIQFVMIRTKDLTIKISICIKANIFR